MTFPKIPNLHPYSWAAIAFVVLFAVVLAFWLLGAPGREAATATKAKADTAFSESRTESAKEATSILMDKAAKDAADEDLTRKNRDEILSQPGADAPVDPRVSDAGRRAICLRDAARCRPECVRLLGPCSR